ncbi:ABC transporter substrate-binding protein [Microtetraspora niveoalba]|uniref:ABC transporter substrate-binding protein n=1 Tax=Microtetraspora niveoalba TaxID=46175 RepID=UPI00082F3E07|nr:ABC transporter substrate-binding protein [Microtetraspora niveoalba]
MASPHDAIEELVRRPAFWRTDQPLPVIVVTGSDGAAFEAARRLAAPFQDVLPHATVESGEYGTLRELVAGLAGEQGQLGKPVGGSFLPPPRFSLVQFVLWARRQRDEPPSDDGTAGRWPPDPRSRKGQDEFKQRVKEWRRARYGGDRGRRTSADFIGRAATTWVPLGTLAVWLAGGASDLVGLIPWAFGILVALAGTAGQAVLSIRGSYFNVWFRRQPYVTRRRFERLPRYALRLANASDDEIDRLLVHAFCQDLRQAYKKWIIPQPGWGRGLYGMLVLEARGPGEATERFLQILEETGEDTGLLAPILVLVALPEELREERTRAVPTHRLARLPALVADWRGRVRRRVPRLRLVVEADGPLPDTDHRPRLLGSRMRSLGYWSVVALLLVGPAAWAVQHQRDRQAHCGGLAWAERVDGECVGVVNASGPAPRDLFRPEVTRLIAEIDKNNASAGPDSVSVVLFGEYSIRDPELPADEEDGEGGGKAVKLEDSRWAGALAELTAVGEYQRTVRSNPRLRVLVANSGDNLRQGRRGAELIRELAEHDPHVVGVIGFPRSVEGVREAIQVLHEAKIPMVGTTGTADELGYVRDGPAESTKLKKGPSRYYFHVGPTNFREATLMARFARRALRSGSAVIVRDKSSGDQYTDNLAEDLDAALKRESVDVRPGVEYSVPDGGITDAAGEACDESPDVYLYAGRAPEFLDFLRALEKTPCGARTVRVIASDDVIKVVTDHGEQITNMPRIEVYYAALASRTMWTLDGDPKPTEFVAALLKGAHENASDDNLIITYDAADVIYQAANRAYSAEGSPSKGDILYELAFTSGSAALNGASGVVDFADVKRHDPADKAIAIMRVVGAAPAHSKVEVRCGRLATAGSSVAVDSAQAGGLSGLRALCQNLPDAPPGESAPRP